MAQIPEGHIAMMTSNFVWISLGQLGAGGSGPRDGGFVGASPGAGCRRGAAAAHRQPVVLASRCGAMPSARCCAPPPRHWGTLGSGIPHPAFRQSCGCVVPWARHPRGQIDPRGCLRVYAARDGAADIQQSCDPFLRASIVVVSAHVQSSA